MKKLNKESLGLVVGSRLREARSHSGLSQLDLQNQTGIDRGTLSRIENGHQEVSLFQLLQILTVLNVNIQDFLNGVEVDNDN